MKRTCYIFLLLPWSGFTQLSINSTGGDYSNAIGSMSISVGQSMTNYIEEGPQAINEGVQQPYEYFSLSTKEAQSFLNIELFPNPTTGIIHLKGDLIKGAQMKLMDTNGKIIFEEYINDTIHSIELKDLSSGVYNLQITNNSQNNTTRIIKH